MVNWMDNSSLQESGIESYTLVGILALNGLLIHIIAIDTLVKYKCLVNGVG